ncbi:hypothetical protein, partial [uncultured Helicobacter sp.]|uniref:beta strand repeat-containing protein n=1 Tax=uncultured Helicobacter sp. TaxID=175537 RepID=UPI00262B25DA
MATALCAENNTDSSDKITLTDPNAPTITITTTEQTHDEHFSWDNPNPQDNQNKITWKNTNGMLSATIESKSAKEKNGNSTTSLKNLQFTFSNPHSKDISKSDITIYNNGKVVVKAGNQASAIALDFGGRGLSLVDSSSNSTKGDLEIWFGANPLAIQNKTFTIKNLTTLDGNLKIAGGSGNNSFDITAQTINGDILFGSGALDDSDGKSVITITKALNGNISQFSTAKRMDPNHTASENNGVKVKFINGAKMKGDIRGYGVGYDALKRNVIFTGGSGVVLEGNVFSYGTNPKTEVGIDITAGNHITFESGDMLGSFVSATGNGMNGEKGYNNITFSSGGVQTLKGGILTIDRGSNNQAQSITTLNVQKGTTLKILENASGNTIVDKGSACSIGSSSRLDSCIGNFTTAGNSYGTVDKDFTITTGSIVSDGYGTNTINIDSGSTLILNDGKGAITLTTTPIKHQDTDRARAVINFGGVNGKIIGKVETGLGLSAIDVAEGASGTITGSVTLGKTSSGASSSGNIDQTGNFTGANVITLGATAKPYTTQKQTTATLTLEGKENTITQLSANATNSILILGTNNIGDNANKNTTTITTLTHGSNLTTTFASGSGEKTLILSENNANSDSSNSFTLKALTLGNGSTNNTLDLTSTTTKTTITDQIDVGVGQGVTIKLKGQELELTGGMNTTGGTSTINVTANGASANATLSGGDVTLTNLDLVAGNNGSSNAQLTLKNDNTTISTITANAESDTIAANAIGQGGSSPKLTLDAQGASKAITASTSSISGNGLILELKGDSNSNKATFNINGGSNTIKTLTLSGTAGNILNANAGNTTITDAIEVKDSKTLDLGIGNGNLTLTKNL